MDELSWRCRTTLPPRSLVALARTALTVSVAMASDTRSPAAWLKLVTESCPLVVDPLSHKVSLPPAKAIRAEPLPDEPSTVSYAPPKTVELPPPSAIH